MKKYGFPPIINEHSEILILGSMPGDASIAAQEYYAHKQNAFWRLLSAIFNNSQILDNYQQKRQLILNNKLALWDVLSAAHRNGSMDTDIKNEEYNNLFVLLNEYPKIKTLIFNGQKAYKSFKKAFPDLLKSKEYYIMLSTSPANAKYNFEYKLQEWKKAINK